MTSQLSNYFFGPAGKAISDLTANAQEASNMIGTSARGQMRRGSAVISAAAAAASDGLAIIGDSIDKTTEAKKTMEGVPRIPTASPLASSEPATDEEMQIPPARV